VSSAGTTLLIPDCELTEMPTAEAFYLKQIAFILAIPMIFVGACVVWVFIFTTCGKRCWKSTWDDIKDRMILTITLMVFLCYPTLVRMCLSMFKCVVVGEQRYLMADLQELCFQGRHSTYIGMLAVPQMILLTIIPAAVLLFLHRNKKHLDTPRFRIRYGLLYRGYVKDREWWEVTVAFRKVSAVAIGTFDVIIGIPEVQVSLSIFLGLVSIVMHLLGQPFGTKWTVKNSTLHGIFFSGGHLVYELVWFNVVRHEKLQAFGCWRCHAVFVYHCYCRDLHCSCGVSLWQNVF